MTSAILTCPGCGEANSDDMAFCIYCGSALKLAPGTPTPPTIVAAHKTSLSTMRPGGLRACTSCGQADNLNGQFCIFCGSRVELIGLPPIGTGVTPLASGIAPAVAQDMQKQTESRAAKARTAGMVMMVLAGLVGAAAGVATSYATANHSPAPTTSVELPAKGLVILTKEPHAWFRLSWDGDRRYLTGKAGPEGDIAIEDAQPGKYHLLVKGSGGKKWEHDITVSAGAPFVAGNADEGEIFQ